MAVARHNDPGKDVSEQAQASTKDSAGCDGDPHERHIDFEVLGKPSAHTGDFLFRTHTIQAPRFAGRRLAAALAPDWRFVTALAAEIILIARLNSALRAIHVDLLAKELRDCAKGSSRNLPLRHALT
jgi:hypothetical protein